MGLNEDTIRFISAKKDEPEWMLEWRLEAYRRWLTMDEPNWARVHYPKIDFQDMYYYSAPKGANRPKSLDEVDPALLEMYEKLGVPLKERELLAGVEQPKVAVDAVIDSVSVATTFRAELNKMGIIFCSISEAIREYPDLVKQYLGSVVPPSDNYYATLNSAVFTDGSFCYIPKGVRCPMELSTYFRINEAKTGQFERTLLIADEGAYVSLSRGLHGAGARRASTARGGGRAGRHEGRRDQVLDGPELVPGRQGRQGRRLQFRHQARRLPRRQFQDQLDAGRDRFGHHLEVPELHPARRQFVEASSTRSRFRTATSRSTAAPR